MNKNSNINILEEIKNTNDNKYAEITARKILKKYKNMKIPKKTYLIDEQDVELYIIMNCKKIYLKVRALLKRQIKYLIMKRLKEI